MERKILEIESLRKYYGRRENQTRALDGITLQVTKGEFLGIMGSSGSGKSTLLNCIATVTQPTEGRILMDGKEIGSLKGKSWPNTEAPGSDICFRILNCLIT